MNNILEQDDIKIEDMIYEIRGKQVMLDSNLAKLYHCTNGTKDINKAVKRNIDRFPKEFMFQLTENEYMCLRFQIGTLKNGRGQHKKYLPFAFTEQGVAMLAGVLHSDIAIKTSIKIINAFVAMRHLISNNEFRLSNIESKIIEHDNDIKLLQESFDKLEEKKKINEIHFNGQIYDAYSKILEIFTLAKKELIIIDSYADSILLDIVRRLKVKVILITKENNLLSKQEIKKYNMQYHNLTIIYNNTFHDRYFIIDDNQVYHCGASINRVGYKTFSINLISDKDAYKQLINKVNNLTLK